MTDSFALTLYVALAAVAGVSVAVWRRKQLREKHGASSRRHTLLITVSTLSVALVLGITAIYVGTTVGANEDVDDNSSWNLKVMSARELERYSTADNQTIAFLDTGINDELRDHLGDRITAVYNAMDESDQVQDDNGHGTSMVSVACGDGYKGVYGQAVDADIVIVKVTDENGNTNNDVLLKGLKFARSVKATVVNVSLGGFKTDDSVTEQIDAMIKEGISIVAASGDQGNKDLLFPASSNGVISIAASQGDYSLWKDSNTAANLTGAFPGYGITVLYLDEEGSLKRGVDTGTSEACAIASAYIAQYRAFTQCDDNQRIVAMIRSLDTLSGNAVNYLKPFEAQ